MIAICPHRERGAGLRGFSMINPKNSHEPSTKSNLGHPCFNLLRLYTLGYSGSTFGLCTSKANTFFSDKIGPTLDALFFIYLTRVIIISKLTLSLFNIRKMSYHQNYCWENEFQYHSELLLPQESTSLRSQQSLQSIPSLTPQHHPENHHHSTWHHCITTLKGHNSYISSLALNGKFLYTGSSDKEIRMWQRNILSSELDHENLDDSMVIAGKGAVKSLVVLADKIISAHQDHKIRVWQIDNHETNRQKFMHLATLPTLSDRALRLLIPKNHVQIRRHKTSTWVHHADTVSALALSTDNSLIYSVSWDRTLKIWRANDFKCLESVWNAHDDAINAVALSNDGHVYTGSADKKIKVWMRNSGK